MDRYAPVVDCAMVVTTVSNGGIPLKKSENGLSSPVPVGVSTHNTLILRDIFLEARLQINQCRPPCDFFNGIQDFRTADSSVPELQHTDRTLT